MAPGGVNEPPGGRKQISGSGHCWRLAPGGRGSSARRYDIAEVLKVKWRLAARAGASGGGGEWCLAAWWMFMMRCFGWGPSYECNLVLG